MHCCICGLFLAVWCGVLIMFLFEFGMLGVCGVCVCCDFCLLAFWVGVYLAHFVDSGWQRCLGLLLVVLFVVLFTLGCFCD